MSEIVVQAEAVIPEAILVTQDPFAPPEDRASFERFVQRNLRQEAEPEARGRRDTRAGRRSRYVSSSPPANRFVDRQAEIALTNYPSTEIIGAPRSVWDRLISEFRIQMNDDDRDMLPPHLVLESLMRQFTRLNLTAGDDQGPPSDSDSDSDDEIPANYVECVYVKSTKTYHRVYVGGRGGKYYYNHNGQSKYIKNRNDISFADPDTVPIINNNPVLNTTTVVLP